MEQYNDGKKILKFPSSIATKNSDKINNRRIHSAANKIKKMIKKSSKDGDKSIHLDYNFFTFNSCGCFAERIAEALKAEGYDVNHFLTDTNAWFLTTDVPNGMKHFVRTPLQNSMDGDFDTGNVRYKARERYSFGWSDPLGMYGSPGA